MHLQVYSNSPRQIQKMEIRSECLMIKMKLNKIVSINIIRHAINLQIMKLKVILIYKNQSTIQPSIIQNKI